MGGARLLFILCIFRLIHAQLGEAHQIAASAHSMRYTTQQIGLVFERPQVWRYLEVISSYAQLNLALIHVFGGLE